MISLTSDQQFYGDEILQALQNAVDPNDYDVLQLVGILTHFAKQGDHEAKQLVYDQFVTHIATDDWDALAQWNDLISLDGVDGFLFGAEKFGKLVLEQDDYDPPYRFEINEEDWDEEDRVYWNAAQQQAPQNPALAAYVAIEKSRHQKNRRKKRRTPLSSLPYDQLKQKIGTKGGDYALSSWGEQASEDDLAFAAADLMKLDKQADALLLRKYLAIFRKRRFPLDPQFLMDLAEDAKNGPEYDDNGSYALPSRIVLNALNALAHINSPAVRQLGIKLIEEADPWLLGESVALLGPDWQESDWALLETLTQKKYEPNEYHDLGLAGVAKVFDQHPSPNAG